MADAGGFGNSSQLAEPRYNLSDLFGHTPAKPIRPDIRNQRESVAEEKARLCLELNSLCKSPPRSLNSASINVVRAWRVEHKAASKILASKGTAAARSFNPRSTA